MSSATRSSLRSEVQLMLKNDDYWTDAELNSFLKSAYDKWVRWFKQRNPDFLMLGKSITYTGGAMNYDLSGAFSEEIQSIEMVTDITNGTPGYPLLPADSYQRLVEMQQTADSGDLLTGRPTHFYFNRTYTLASGVHTLIQEIYLAPVPGADRTLYLIGQFGPQAFSADTHTTGMPDYMDRLIVLEAVLLARIQEESPNTSGIEKLIASAEYEAARQARHVVRGPGRIIYDPHTID